MYLHFNFVPLLLQFFKYAYLHVYVFVSMYLYLALSPRVYFQFSEDVLENMQNELGVSRDVLEVAAASEDFKVILERIAQYISDKQSLGTVLPFHMSSESLEQKLGKEGEREREGREEERGEGRILKCMSSSSWVRRKKKVWTKSKGGGGR